MNIRSTTLVLPLSQSEKDFLLKIAEETHLSISDFVLLSALALNMNTEIVINITVLNLLRKYKE